MRPPHATTNQPVALTIAGSDPSGGAGLQADLKTFHQHRVYGMSVVTLLTVQNTLTVSAVEMVPSHLIEAQLQAVCDDIPPQAAKTGALGNAETIEIVARKAADFKFPLVVDPVMISKHGARLIDDSARDSLIDRLLPHAFLVTPNRFEAAALTGRVVDTVIDMESAAAMIAGFGAANVLIKGLIQDDQSVDLLWCDGKSHWIRGELTQTSNTHGSGCVFAAAITAQLACGQDLLSAVTLAKRFITEAIRTSPGLGQGRGPVNMLA
jgi:hydroxymethylpyrimidine/phosphomethylpyrimidine kinase